MFLACNLFRQISKILSQCVLSNLDTIENVVPSLVIGFFGYFDLDKYILLICEPKLYNIYIIISVYICMQ